MASVMHFELKRGSDRLNERKEAVMNRKIKNLLGTWILDGLAFFGMSGFWVMGLALAPVKRQKSRRI